MNTLPPLDEEAFQQARAHFKRALVELCELPPSHIYVYPEQLELLNDTTHALRAGRFFALIGNTEAHQENGWQPVQGFATPEDEIVLSDDLTHLGALIRATGVLEEPPESSARELAERLLFIFPEQGFLVSDADGYPEADAPALRRDGGDITLTACVVQPEDMGRYTLWRLILTLNERGEVMMEREELDPRHQDAGEA